MLYTPLPCHLVSFRSAFLTTQFTFFSSPLQNVLRNATQHRAFLEWWSWSKQSQTLAGGSCGYPSAPDFRPCHLRLKNKLNFAAEQIASCTHTRACGTHTSYFAAISELAASLCTSQKEQMQFLAFGRCESLSVIVSFSVCNWRPCFLVGISLNFLFCHGFHLRIDAVSRGHL